MSALVGVLPLVTVALGALLLMLAEAFGKPATVADAGSSCGLDSGAGRSGECGVTAGLDLNTRTGTRVEPDAGFVLPPELRRCWYRTD